MKRKDESQRLRTERNDEAKRSIPQQLLIKKVSVAPLSETQEQQRASQGEVSPPKIDPESVNTAVTPIFSSSRKKVSLFLPEIGNNPKLDAHAAEKKFLSRTSLGH